MIKNVDHIGIAVKSLEVAIPHYEQLLGVKCEKIEEVASQKVRTGFFNVGGTHIELLEGTSEDSPVSKFIEKKGEGIHHLAFGTDNSGEELLRAKENGASLIDETPRPGANGKMIGFIHPKSTHGVLTEFCSGGAH
jgi:methylmalonyl-CoA/ethylmalonyl-CoA epimerase